MSKINFNVVHPASKEWTSEQSTNLMFPSPSFKHVAMLLFSITVLVRANLQMLEGIQIITRSILMLSMNIK